MSAPLEVEAPQMAAPQPSLDSKRPRTILAGPYGHPFHPAVVTIPIGAWVASLVFDIASRASRDPAVFVKGAFWLIGIGIVGALVAAVFGLLDLMAIQHHPVDGESRHTRAFILGVVHMDLNLIVLSLYIADFFLRRGRLDHSYAGVLPLSLSIIALVVLGVGGWIGGVLAYRYGVRVAAESVQAEGFR